MSTQKIGVLGSGIVAQKLGAGFVREGHAVMLGTRHPQKLAEWQAKTGEQVGTFAEAAAFGELLVLAVTGRVAQDVLQQVEPAIRGKVVIDPTNPIAEGKPVAGVLPFFTDPNRSLHEMLQATFPEVRLVKAFSHIGAPFMYRPDFPGGPPSLFICGNDATAKSQVSDICAHFGFDVIDMGPAEAARAIEPLCRLWCIPGLIDRQWEHAFKWLRRY
jgi:hypothetical protein